MVFLQLQLPCTGKGRKAAKQQQGYNSLFHSGTSAKAFAKSD
jgi:hypothetical protein